MRGEVVVPYTMHDWVLGRRSDVPFEDRRYRGDGKANAIIPLTASDLVRIHNKEPVEIAGRKYRYLTLGAREPGQVASGASAVGGSIHPAPTKVETATTRKRLATDVELDDVPTGASTGGQSISSESMRIPDLKCIAQPDIRSCRIFLTIKIKLSAAPDSDTTARNMDPPYPFTIEEDEAFAARCGGSVMVEELRNATTMFATDGPWRDRSMGVRSLLFLYYALPDML
ncbi:hypothetical protein C8R44DRAFT_346928 [Mycena epipterygia]|nr:hypothetical protein C8R44DRAFT_346928 [Mycena epipterygia]